MTAIRFCFWPILEPFWANLAFRVRGVPLLHPLELVLVRAGHASRVAAANVGRLLFWAGLVLCALTLRDAMLRPLSGEDELFLY